MEKYYKFKERLLQNRISSRRFLRVSVSKIERPVYALASSISGLAFIISFLVGLRRPMRCTLTVVKAAVSEDSFAVDFADSFEVTTKRLTDCLPALSVVLTPGACVAKEQIMGQLSHVGVPIVNVQPVSLAFWHWWTD